MGTLGNLVFDLGEKAVAKLAPSVTHSGVGEEVGRWISKTFSLESQLTGESGQALKGYLKKYESVRDAHLSTETQANQTLPPHQQQQPYIVNGRAQMKARNQMFGPKDQLMQGFVDAIAREHGENKAKNVVDALGVYFHDSVYQQGTGEASRLASNLKAKNSLVEDIDFRNSPYRPAGDAERSVHQYTASALAYKAGLAHATTPLNALIGRSLTSFAKASTHLFGDGYQAARSQMLAHNAIGQIFAEEHQQLYDFQNGLIQKFAPGSIGEFVSKNWMIPGLSTMRQRTATMLAMQGKYAAQELYERLGSQNITTVERAKYDLKRLGLDPAKLAAQKGLLPEDIRNAMFNNTNDRMFLQSGMNRAPAATSTTIGRFIGMFHQYGAAQANFIQKELVAAIRDKKDPVSAIKTIAILGTVFPAVGGAIHGLEDLWMGKGSDKAKEDVRGGLGLGEGVSLANKLDAFTHTAGFGVMTSYGRAVGRAKLAEAMLGPTANAAIELTQDSYKAATKSNEGKGEYDVKSYAPLMRDLLHDVPSLGVGSVLAEKIFPTQQNLNKQKPMTSKRLKAAQSAERRKMKKQLLKGE